MTPLFSVSPRKITQILLLAVLCLTVLSVVSNFVEYFVGHEAIVGTEAFVELFDLDREENIPTWYTSSTLLLCFFLLATIARSKRRKGASYVSHWVALSIIFLYFSVDEAGVIHEKLAKWLNTFPNPGGFHFSPWVILIATFALIFFSVYRRFLAGLPPETRRQFFLAGAVFFAGALVVDTIGEFHAGFYGNHNMTHSMITTVEEFLEMVGIVVFIRALVIYMSSHVKDVLVSFDYEKPKLQ